MKQYSVKIKMITRYLQARFSEDAKKELTNYVSRGIVKSDEDSWVVFLHMDDNGVYIPSQQVRNCLVNGGRELKYKKTRRSLQQWVISNIIIEPEKIYLGKQKPDEVVTSYPSRKDGNRITIKHPSFNVGMEVEFTLKSLDDDMEQKAIKDLIEISGKNYGIGARRRDMFGRFSLISISEEA